jgi:protein SCO1/2
MQRLYLAILATALLCAAPAWAETPSAVEDTQPEVGIVSRYLLMDTKGRAISDQDFRGSFQLITFGYTFCPDICPTTLAEMSLIMEKLGARAEQLQPLFVTVDPERDTPEVLRRYTAFFHPRIIGLTGSPELVRRVAEHFKVRYEKHWEPGAEKDKYSVDHSAGMYLLGQDGRFLKKFAYATPPQEVADRILALMEDANLPLPAKRPPVKKTH